MTGYRMTRVAVLVAIYSIGILGVVSTAAEDDDGLSIEWAYLATYPEADCTKIHIYVKNTGRVPRFLEGIYLGDRYLHLNLLSDLADKTCKGRIQGEAGRIFEASTRAQALARLERCKRRWEQLEPVAMAHFVRDIDRMLLFYESPRHLRRRLKTSNPLERFMRELNREFKRMGVFPSVRSWERMTYLVYRQLLERGYGPTQPKSNFTRNT